MPKNIKQQDFSDLNIDKIFYDALARVDALRMYDSFLQKGWTTELVVQTREVLIPEIVRTITLAWAAAFAEAYNGK
jgi:hypothetical protein